MVLWTNVRGTLKSQYTMKTNDGDIFFMSSTIVEDNETEANNNNKETVVIRPELYY